MWRNTSEYQIKFVCILLVFLFRYCVDVASEIFRIIINAIYFNSFNFPAEFIILIPTVETLIRNQRHLKSTQINDVHSEIHRIV